MSLTRRNTDLRREEGVERARTVFSEVRERDPGYQIFDAFEMTVLAGQLYREGRVEEALEAARLRLLAYPQDYLSYEWLANLHFKAENWVEALENYASAYGMLSLRERTDDVSEELLWYEQRIASVRDRLSE